MRLRVCAEAAPSTDLDEDHKLLLRCVLPLLKSRNSGVVLAVASIYQYLGPGGNVEDSLVGKAVVRVMRNHREIEFVVLTNIAVMAAENPGMFRKYIKDFYVTVRAYMGLRNGNCNARACFLRKFISLWDDFSTNIFHKAVACARTQRTGEIALAGSRRLRSTLAAVPVLFAHAVVTDTKNR
jgi:hypothetical protein